MLLINASLVNAQTFDEWFKQKETQINYLVEQIGAIKAYDEVINKGYDIAHNGLTNVFTSKERDYQQHSSYFLSLWKVKANIKTYNKVASIIEMRTDIEKLYQKIGLSKMHLNNRESNYISMVFSNLIQGCNDLIDQLDMMINDGRLQLKDDERIQYIDKIFAEMRDRYQFSQAFANEIRLLDINRLKEGNDISRSYSLYNIK